MYFFHFPKVPKYFQIAPPIGKQAFNYLSLCGIFSFKPPQNQYNKAKLGGFRPLNSEPELSMKIRLKVQPEMSPGNKSQKKAAAKQTLKYSMKR